MLKIFAIIPVFIISLIHSALPASLDELAEDFTSPPDSASPGVYWYFMDGNLSASAMTDELESMKAAGIGNLVFLEVNVGIPRGPVKFMSEQWQDLFVHAVHEAERLGIDITLGAGPGWTGSGGPWIKPQDAMQHLCYSIIETKGPSTFDDVLPLPPQNPTQWGNMHTDFYEDVAVYAFPKCPAVISDIDEKALYNRNPYTSMAGVKPYLPAPAKFTEPGDASTIAARDIIDLTSYITPEGKLNWDVPSGEWKIVRMARRATCTSTRPAPEPGVGLECDKFSKAGLDVQLANYYDKLLAKAGQRKGKHGWTAIHLDSWEMGAQNWTVDFLNEFKSRRSYDARPYLLAYTGHAIDTVEKTERFLWDIRLTSQELVLENYAGYLKEYGHNNGFELSIEPYDMNPTADLDLGAVADVPMCEFWSAGMGFNSTFSCIESSSIAHTMGKSIVSSEAFTADYNQERWLQYPYSMKNQGDWAFAMGINRFVYHTFCHSPLGSQYRPGMTMAGYGVHWDKNQTWWPMVKAYHKYISRCSHLLREGTAVADILYLTPEGAPHVFCPPPSALEGSGPLADKKGYAFDGCSPKIMIDRAEVINGRIAFPDATSYSLLVLPEIETMTPELLRKIELLISNGAVVIGSPPLKSPSLTNYPACDKEVLKLARQIWGTLDTPKSVTKRRYGQGSIYWGGVFSSSNLRNNLKILPNAKWIWYPESNPKISAPAETRYFKKVIKNVPAKTVISASVSITADNSFILYVNGNKAAEGNNFNKIQTTNVDRFLVKDDNVITVSVVNEGQSPNPAGLIAAIELVYSDGTNRLIYSDDSWLAGYNTFSNWHKLMNIPQDWKQAAVLGDYSSGPWNLSPKINMPDLYPNYEDTVDILQKMNINEDFATDGPIRYAHRTTNHSELYFISNKTSLSVETECTFRVDGSEPQIWDPVTGNKRTLPEHNSVNGKTAIPLKFAPYQSFFIVFPTADSPSLAQPTNRNYDTPEIIQNINGKWEVCFDPEWGGPAKTTFDNLIDWTVSSDRGIKYYSGIASYHKEFNFIGTIDTKHPIYIDLGTVHDIAHVRLNGKDVGTIWCDPWQIEISNELITGTNKLEIDIANRWANRMIGDQQQPDANVRTLQWQEGFLKGKQFNTGRYTFATSQPYDKLLPSGLIGPVKIIIYK